MSIFDPQMPLWLRRSRIPFRLQMCYNKNDTQKEVCGMYIAICDDNQQELKRIAGIVEKHAGSYPLRFQLFSNAEAMLKAAETEHFTHYFLDIMMPCMDGITAAQEIRSFDTDAQLVFLTSFKEYAYQSYRVKAYDYLLKPVDSQQLHALLQQLHHMENASEASLLIPKGRSFFRISPNRLAYLEVSRKKLHFHMTDGQILQAAGTLAEFEPELLSRPGFVKIHRSYIVNLHHISVLSPAGCIMQGGQNLPVSRLLYNQVRQRYMAHLFEETEG